MRARFRLPMFVVAAALLGLIALLATLQYRWLGQISTAERERMKTSLAGHAAAFAQDFDREITRAYLTFQADVLHQDANLAGRVAGSFDHWQEASRYPRLLKDVYLVTRSAGAPDRISRFNPATRFIEPAEWPQALEPIRTAMLRPEPEAASPETTLVVRTMLSTIWAEVPALVVPTPVLLVDRLRPLEGKPPGDFRFASSMTYTVLTLDRDYITGEMFPALAQQHFRGATEAVDYDLAIVSTGGKSTVYTTNRQFSPDASAPADAAADLFQIRAQDYAAMAADVRRTTSFIARTLTRGAAAAKPGSQVRSTEVRGMMLGGQTGTITMHETPPVSIVLQHNLAGGEGRKALDTGLTAAAVARPSAPAWRLVVKHPSGSLETAVANVRRRNLVVSSGILAILGISVGVLVVSTRRAQDLARQQMEFVAAVSHELRTPLAVIRSAADNLAEGVVRGDAPVRKYGELVRGEGRRLSEMVEQILELAGIQSGQRSFALRPVPLVQLLHEVVEASETLLTDARIEVEYDVAEHLPPVLGDEPALRRVFQNLVGNAIKYGANGRWIGLTARASGREVVVTVADRGIGIEAAEHENIFKPFYRAPGVIDAQIQGAGLGLSLVQRIVEAHGGRITVRSESGRGSDFTVHLPAASEEPITRTTSAAQDPAPSSARG